MIDCCAVNQLDSVKDLLWYYPFTKDHEKKLQQSYQQAKLLHNQFIVVQSTYSKLAKDFESLREITLALDDCICDNDSIKECLQKTAKIYKEHCESLNLLTCSDGNLSVSTFDTFMQNVEAMPSRQKAVKLAYEQWELAQLRAVSVVPSKIEECRDADQHCSDTYEIFRNESSSYLSFLKSLHISRNLHSVESKLKFIKLHRAYFKSMNEFFINIDPWIEYLNVQVEFLNEQCIYVGNRASDPHLMFSIKSVKSGSGVSGYLYMKKSWRQWTRKWFKIVNNQLLYYSHDFINGVNEPKCHVLENDLSTCTARIPDAGSVGHKRRFCFELITTTGSHFFQAFSEEEFDLWFQFLKLGMSNKLNQTRSLPSFKIHLNNTLSSENSSADLMNYKNMSECRLSEECEHQPFPCVTAIRKISGNDRCCDCNAVEPDWAVCNLGITLCDACSGIHRSFGVQVSKVKSLVLDHWDSASTRLMLALGNDKVNGIVLANTALVEEFRLKIIVQSDSSDLVYNNSLKPDVEGYFSSQDARQRWLKAKWIDKQFLLNLYVTVPETEKCFQATIRLWQSLLMRDVSGLLEAVLNGADVNGSLDNSVNYCHESCVDLTQKLARRCGKPNSLNCETPTLDANVTPLMCAVCGSSLAITSFLIANGSDINACDDEGCTALHYAVYHEKTQQVWLLLQRRANQEISSESGETPLSLALTKQHADMVTLLRIHRLKSVSILEDGMLNNNDVIDDVFSDFRIRSYGFDSSSSCDESVDA